MRWILFILIILAAAILEAGNLLNLIAFNQGQIRPSILICLLVYVSVHARPEEAVISSFAIGFAADLAGPVMGPYTICYGLAGSLLTQTQGLLAVRRPVHQVFVVFITAILVTLTAHWLAMLKTSQTAAFPFPVLAGCALYSAAVAPPIWPLLNLLWKFLYKPLSRRPPRSRTGHV